MLWVILSFILGFYCGWRVAVRAAAEAIIAEHESRRSVT